MNAKTALSLLLFCLALCSCKKAKEYAAETKQSYEAIEETAQHLVSITAALRTNDFAAANEIVAKLKSAGAYSRALETCIYVLTIELHEGVPAAKLYVQSAKTNEHRSPEELTALTEIEKYLQRKSEKPAADETADSVVTLVGAAIVEEKYGHGAGAMVLKACRILADPTSAAASLLTNGTTDSTTRLDKIHGTWALQDAPEGKVLMEYRPNGDFVGTRVDKQVDLADVILGKWTMSGNTLVQRDNQMVTFLGHLVEVIGVTNTILSWSSNQITFMEKPNGLTNILNRVEKQPYLGDRAASSSRLNESVLRKERTEPRGVYRR